MKKSMIYRDPETEKPKEETEGTGAETAETTER